MVLSLAPFSPIYPIFQYFWEINLNIGINYVDLIYTSICIRSHASSHQLIKGVNSSQFNPFFIFVRNLNDTLSLLLSHHFSAAAP